MKKFFIIPLLILPACSSGPKIILQPMQPPPATNNATVRYPEIIRAYHVGRYADAHGSVMHEQHTFYRVEENARWNFHPGVADMMQFNHPPNVAFNPAPVNDAVVAEVNAQRLATVQIMAQAQTLSLALAKFQAALELTRTNLQEMAGLRASLADVKKRLAVLESAPAQQSPNLSTNSATGLLEP